MHKKIIFLLLPLWLGGCAQFGSALRTTALAGGGALLGSQLSHGNPYAAMGGGVAGVLVSEGYEALKTSSEKKAFTRGFEKGRSDGVKQIYWNLQDAQRRP